MRALRTKHTKYVVSITLILLVVLTLLPFLMTVLLSFKTDQEVMYDFWGKPRKLRWIFFEQALGFIGNSIFNSTLIASLSVTVLAFLSSLSGYVFARLDFPGKNTLYVLIMALMMIPGILTLIPLFLWFKEFPGFGGNDWLGNGGHGFLNSRWALLIHYVAGGQVIGIFLCRTFIENLPQYLFDSARMDGASDLHIYRKIVVPLSMPVIATVSILNFVAIYNDYVWPLVTINDESLQMFSVRVTQYTSTAAMEGAPEFASYIIGSLPLILVFAFGMKYYIDGLTKGAVKG